MLVEQTATHLAQGISTQPEHLRADGQMADAVNVIPDVTYGLRRRPGTRIVTKIASPATTTLRVHPIDRDSSEQYLLVYGDGVLKVYDTAGVEQTVTGYSGDAKTYLDLNSASASQMRTLTIKDTTYIVNTTVPPRVEDQTTYSSAGTYGTYAEMIEAFADSGHNRTYPVPGDYVTVTADETFAGETTYYRFMDTPGPSETLDLPPVIEWGTLGADYDAATDFYDDETGSRRVGGARVMCTRAVVENATGATFTASTRKLTFTAGEIDMITTDDTHILITASTSGGTNLNVDSRVPAGKDAVQGCQYGQPNYWYAIEAFDLDADPPTLTLNASEVGGVSDCTAVTVAQVGRLFEGRLPEKPVARGTMLEIAKMFLGDIGDDAGGFREASAKQTQVGIEAAPAGFRLEYVNTGTPSTSYFRMTSPFTGQYNRIEYVEAVNSSTRPDGWGADFSYAGTGSSGKPFDVTAIQNQTKGTGTNETTIRDVDALWSPVPQSGSALSVVNPTTMPVKLERLEVGSPSTFTLMQERWAGRITGTAGTNPAPKAFDNNTPISDLFLFQGRLGFLCGPRVVLSAADDLTRFFNLVATSIVDADPVEVLPSSSSVTFLQRALPFQGNVVILGSNGRQYELGSSGAFSQDSATMNATTDVTTVDVGPVPMGQRVYLATPDGVEEYDYVEDTVPSSTNDISRHVIGLIPADLTRLVSDASSGSVIAIKAGQNEMQAYYTWFTGQQREQSAWVRWTLPSGITATDGGRIGDNLYLLTDDGSGDVFIESLELDAPDAESGWQRHAYVDRGELVTIASESGTLTVLDYTDVDTAVGGPGLSGVAEATEFPITTGSGSTVNIDDTSGGTAPPDGSYIVGVGMESSFVLTRPFVRDRNGRPDLNLDLLWDRLTVRHRDSTSYTVTVEDTAPTRTKVITGNITATNNAPVGLRGSAGTVPIRGRADNVTTTVSVDDAKQAIWVGLEHEVVQIARMV